jgi:hypothetical protein
MNISAGKPMKARSEVLTAVSVKILSAGLCRRVVVTIVSDDPAAPFFRVEE